MSKTVTLIKLIIDIAFVKKELIKRQNNLYKEKQNGILDTKYIQKDVYAFVDTFIIVKGTKKNKILYI